MGNNKEQKSALIKVSAKFFSHSFHFENTLRNNIRYILTLKFCKMNRNSQYFSEPPNLYFYSSELTE